MSPGPGGDPKPTASEELYRDGKPARSAILVKVTISASMAESLSQNPL